jgi:hypothetical protein
MQVPTTNRRASSLIMSWPRKKPVAVWLTHSILLYTLQH